MLVSDFDYDLPKELIAQVPLEKRDLSRMMVLNRAEETISHSHFYNKSWHEFGRATLQVAAA